MFTTKVLSSFKSIFPPIHQPLPLTPLESQRLHKALTASFRAHLDREHGWDATDPSVVLPGSVPPITYLPSTPSASTTDDAARRRPTDRHLRAILNNPLFRQPDTPSSAVLRSSEGQIQPDPKIIFEKAVAKGLMNTKRALGFLVTVKSNVKQSATLSLQQGMAASGAGLLVVQWLRASGLERDLSFIRSRAFTTTLVSFMVAEGLDELAWTWLDRLARSEAVDVDEKLRMSNMLVLSLVAAKTKTVELDAAYSSILHAGEVLEDSAASLEPIIGGWRHLAWHTTVESWRHTKPAAGLFDSFAAMSQKIAKPLRLKVEMAHLQLHHPTDPSPKYALRYLSNDDLWDRALPGFLEKLPATNKNLPYGVKQLMSLGLDTVQYLTQDGQFKEAQRILGLLQTHLGVAGIFGQDPQPDVV
ncbi:hypothetical protein B0T17DRAFT_85767 [Bombardia bombarda]|uniref:Uncharacterized protein n=1 Tax=Bombardia bombarda TaxID=252184 RepID=A0AA39XM73_9PEZI|nr:hypothetical protein B0T17DRAFT_85767 [Bombardia bombarda]